MRERRGPLSAVKPPRRRMAVPSPSLDAALDADLDALVQARSTVFSPELAASFLARSLPLGDYCVYPAGAEAADLLRALDAVSEGISGIRVVRVADRNTTEERQSFHGRPMIVPQELANHPCERILVCHSVREAELLTTLRGLGIAKERIIPVFSHANYRVLSGQAETHNALLGTIGGPRRCVIIRADRSGLIIDDAALATVLPPRETLILNIGTAAERIDSRIYKVVDLYRSLTLLRSALDKIQPEIVYLQLNLHTVHLADLIRRMAPSVTLIYEMWDLWRASVGDLKPEDYGRLLGMSDDMVNLNRRCELRVLNTADLLISKRGGLVWEAECHDFTTPCLQYFVRVGEGTVSPRPVSSSPSVNGPRIIFAATLQTLEVLAAFDYIRLNQDHHAIFAALTADGRATVDLYNAAHRDSSLDPLYASYLERYRDGPIRYHRRVPPTQLLAVMDNYDYGWIRATPAVPSVDCDVVIPASLSSYIAAGLPVIVHATLTYASSLVTRFAAGIVVPVGEEGEDAVSRVLATADPASHRAGALRLRAYMMEHNQRLLGMLRDFNHAVVPASETRRPMSNVVSREHEGEG
jgi:hypothetical protein